ncbi:MAG: 50S ribosomal protein L9 [Parachlamydiaceae bacterium]|nr:50S ribosomal protein L9 [Parachlamydiaceae bacterium]
MAAKLLLIEDVEDLGRSGDLVTVKPGYARNFLIPRKYAVVANAGTLRIQAKLKDERVKKAAVEKQEAESIAQVLAGVTLKTIVKIDHDGRMYGSVSAHDIVELLQSQANIAIEKRTIVLKHAIKETGIHSISVKLKEGIIASFTLKVIPEGSTDIEAPEAEAETEVKA